MAKYVSSVLITFNKDDTFRGAHAVQTKYDPSGDFGDIDMAAEPLSEGDLKNLLPNEAQIIAELSSAQLTIDNLANEIENLKGEIVTLQTST